MRTTIELRDDLHKRALSIARDRNESLSATVNDLLERVLDPPSSRPTVGRDPETGLVTVTLGRPVTTEDVRSLEDDW